MNAVNVTRVFMKILKWGYKMSEWTITPLLAISFDNLQGNRYCLHLALKTLSASFNLIPSLSNIFLVSVYIHKMEIMKAKTTNTQRISCKIYCTRQWLTWVAQKTECHCRRLEVLGSTTSLCGETFTSQLRFMLKKKYVAGKIIELKSQQHG